MSFSLELRNPYFYKKKIPIALLHFSAGFLLLITWNESNLQTLMPVLGSILFLIGLFELVYTFFAFKMLHKSPKINGLVRIVASVAFLFYAGLLFKQKDTSFAIFMLIIGVLFVFIYYIEKKWARPFVIELNESGVLFPGTFKTPLVPWKNFNNVILKDNILTLDLISNKVMQLEMKSVEDNEWVDKINLFCSEKIA